MKNKEKIIEFAISEYSWLQKQGYSKPAIYDEAFATTIDWLGTEIGIELEIDWRDNEVFVLVVRLENGHLPKGYYVSDGKKCRLHLKSMLLNKKLRVNKDLISAIGSKHGELKGFDYLKDELINYRNLLLSCIELLKEGKKLFGKEDEGSGLNS